MWNKPHICMQHLSIPKRKLVYCGVVRVSGNGCISFFSEFIYVHVYAFIPWLCSVKRHRFNDNVFALFLIYTFVPA